MTRKKRRSWTALELLGGAVFGWLPDYRPFNEGVAQLYHWWMNGKRADLRRPVTFNDHVLIEKLSRTAGSDLRKTITDKELVKAHVTALVGPGHTVPTLAVLKSAREVDRFAFPAPCVVKPTHSSQEILHFATQPTREERALLKFWLWKNYYASSREPNYKGLAHKLIVEPVVGGAFGAVEDVKVFCFHGAPKLIQIDRGRFQGRHRRDFFDVEGRPLPIEIKYPRGGEPFNYRAALPRLLELSRKLSLGFAFLRVDFYVDGQSVLVGELTSFPSNCVHPFRPADADRAIARLFAEPSLAISPATFGAAQEPEPLRAEV